MNTRASVVTLIEARTGLDVKGHQRARVRAIIDADARRRGCADEAAHEALLRTDGAVFGELVTRLVVGESYFFRDASQVALLRGVFAALARTPRPISVWSAGCAAGEEPYTLAMLALDAGLAERVRVLGTDLSSAAVERARGARYTRWSLRGVSDEAVARWFKRDGPTYTVRDDARRMVACRVHNLLEGGPGRFDLIVCRNVLMYLTPHAVERAKDVLAQALLPEGWLVTAASDPPLGGGQLCRVRTRHGFAYRPHHAVHPDDRLPAPPGAELVVARPGVGKARRPSEDGAPAERDDTPDPCDAPRRLRSLVEAGRVREASEVVPEALAAAPLDAELRYLASILHLDGGDSDSAAREARAALYLDSSRAEAHIVLAHAQRALGRPGDADRSYRRGARLLDERVVADASADQAGIAGHLATLARRIARARGGGGGARTS